MGLAILYKALIYLQVPAKKTGPLWTGYAFNALMI